MAPVEEIRLEPAAQAVATPQGASTFSSPPRAFFGVWVVRAAFVLAFFGWGVGFYGPPIFLHAVVERTGWPLTLVSTAMTLHFLVGALVITMLPRMHARVGVPVTIIAGAAVTTAGVCGWAIAEHPWELFAAACLSGMGWVTMGAVAINAVVSPWHVRARPMALAKAYNGASIGGVVFSPLWVVLIASLGFAGATGAIGTVMIALMALLGCCVFSKTPEGMRQRPDGDTAPPAESCEAGPSRARLHGASLWRDRAFLTLAFGMAVGVFAQAGLVAHLYSLLVPALGERAAGVLLGAASAAAVLGRTVAAAALARINERRIVGAASYAMQASGALVLLFSNNDQPAMIVAGVMLFGFGIGNAGSLPPLIAQNDFAAPDVSRVVALIAAISQGTYAFAPALFGLLLAASGTPLSDGVGERSAWFFLAAALLQLTAAGAFLAGLRKR
jgi:MFS family permease